MTTVDRYARILYGAQILFKNRSSQWVATPCPNLGNQRPADLMTAGEYDAVEDELIRIQRAGTSELVNEQVRLLRARM